VFKHVNFGISFDSGNNLKVLSLKDADKLTLPETHSEVSKLLDLYESGKQIPIDLLTSSTVTISDLSKTKASYMRPLLNGFQGLILGVVRSKNNLFEIYATFDHRISSGLTVARFLEELKGVSCPITLFQRKKAAPFVVSQLWRSLLVVTGALFESSFQMAKRLVRVEIALIGHHHEPRGNPHLSV
jgi:hypothetical protein